MAPTTGPFRQFLRNYSPEWVLGKLGQGLTQGMVGFLGDLLAEAANSAVIGPMLANEDSPPDAVGRVAGSRGIDRYTTDTVETHRARTIDAWTAWEFAGREESIAGQIVLMGYPDSHIFKDTGAPLPRIFGVVVSTEEEGDGSDPVVLVQQIFRIVEKFRAGEERCGDVTVLSAGRTFDIHPLTGLPHTFDDPGPGIDTFDSSVGTTYRSVA